MAVSKRAEMDKKAISDLFLHSIYVTGTLAGSDLEVQGVSAKDGIVIKDMVDGSFYTVKIVAKSLTYEGLDKEEVDEEKAAVKSKMIEVRDRVDEAFKLRFLDSVEMMKAQKELES